MERGQNEFSLRRIYSGSDANFALGETQMRKDHGAASGSNSNR